ncbi:MAG: hypothetical protein CMJ24_05695 [Phycisphaerae bacterium]|mgnify:CR=1 FL=1|jgi:hypothetical protein|nr:hypothetical protein [Phycisphaerae bacterium]|tara:strand:+ start:2776 stop:4110 length:1335 start_codon:yes stop_codon:yes gene_type:complete
MLCSLLMLLGITCGTQAQIAGLTESMKPEFFTRDLILFIEGLDLDETQQMIVEEMFLDYEQAFEVGLQGMNDEIEEIQGEIESLRDDPQQVLTLVLAPIERWMGQRELLGDELIENVRVILIPEQESKWMQFNRKLYIEQNFSQGNLSGESLNLNHIARDIALDPTMIEAIEPSVELWSIEVIRAMKRRGQLLRGPHATIMETIKASDTEEDIERRRDVVQARIEVRDANERGILAISQSLPEPLSTKFMDTAMMRAYPSAFRRTPAQRVLQTAANNTDYSAELQAAVGALNEQYLLELAAMNDRILISIRENEPEQEFANIRNRERKLDGEESVKFVSPTKAIISERKELGLEYIKRLRELLSPEQFNELEGARRFAPPTTRTNGQGRISDGSGSATNISAGGTGQSKDRGMMPAGKKPGRDPNSDVTNNKKPKGKSKGPRRD